LNFATAGCALKQVNITASVYLGGSAAFVKGTKDKPVWINRTGGYNQIVHFASNMHVILYDIKDRRGWLMDGTSALLHLTCTQLINMPYCSTRQFQLEKFNYARTSMSQKNAAITSLKCIQNKELQIDEGETTTRFEVRTIESDEDTANVDGTKHHTKRERIIETKPWCFKNLVEQTWQALEQIHAHQGKMMDVQDIGIRFTARDQLEGFGFMDIVDNNFPIKPRVTYLKASGRGWAEFTRKIGAVTLFGQGFGSLIEPATNAIGLCKLWNTVPTGQDYLVARIETLKRICSKNGASQSNPLQIAQGIFWHKPHKLFEPCDCRSHDICDIIQVLLPPSCGKKHHPEPFEHTNGAVIFGQSQRWSWSWPKWGNPVQIEEQQSSNDDEFMEPQATISESSIDMSTSADANSSTVNTSQSSETGVTIPNLELSQSCMISPKVTPADIKAPETIVSTKPATRSMDLMSSVPFPLGTAQYDPTKTSKTNSYRARLGNKLSSAKLQILYPFRSKNSGKAENPS